MKILKMGHKKPKPYTPPTYKKKCPKCGSVLEYGYDDAGAVMGLDGLFITCPVCKEEIEVYML